VGNLVVQLPLMEWRYWAILFSCSCFANMLGLNISSAFDSAVTIYILIPILIIPQLLLSGVVINFDKFNPSVGTQKGIPLMGEVMASRWAFEALTVTQFKDNPFEKKFYHLDQKRAIAEYKRLYYIPALETKLATVLHNRGHWRNENNHAVADALELLRTEINYELEGIKKPDFLDVERLRIGKLDSNTLNNTAKFLKILREYYGIRLRDAERDKEKLVASMTDTPEKLEVFNEKRLRYQNEAVTRMVENSSTAVRIVEWDGALVQKVFPIYTVDYRPKNRLDFTANFFVPSKYFLGTAFDTVYFNIGMIWAMTIFLYGVLYFDLLKKMVHALETYKRYRRKKIE